MTDMEKLIIYGAGDLGREYLWFVKEWAPKQVIAGFIDDYLPVNTLISQYPVLGGREYFEDHTDEVCVLCAVSEPAVKKRIVAILRGYGFITFPTMVHPSSVVADSAQLGEGSVVGPGCVISADSVLGRHVVVNQHTSISHHVRIGDYAMLAPGCTIGGHVTIGEGVFMGIGCTASPETHIGDYSVLGAGAVMTGDIPPNCTAVGIPARQIGKGTE